MYELLSAVRIASDDRAAAVRQVAGVVRRTVNPQIAGGARTVEVAGVLKRAVGVEVAGCLRAGCKANAITRKLQLM